MSLAEVKEWRPKNIKSWFSQKDKILHIIAGALIGAFMAWIGLVIINKQHFASTFLWLPGFQLVVSGVIVAWLAGLIKEYMDDKKLSGSWDWQDAWATTLGGFFGSILLWAFIMINGMLYQPAKQPPDSQILNNIKNKYKQMQYEDSISQPRMDSLKMRSDSLLKYLIEEKKQYEESKKK